MLLLLTNDYDIKKKQNENVLHYSLDVYWKWIKIDFWIYIEFATCYRHNWNGITNENRNKTSNIAASAPEVSFGTCANTFLGKCFYARKHITIAHTNTYTQSRKHIKLNCWFSISMAWHACRKRWILYPKTGTDKKIGRIYYLALMRWNEKRVLLCSVEKIGWFLWSNKKTNV